ncbi:MAG: hypothetical protein E3J72_16795 [Planctomycetota bacterium]|nr:MAG: hypothetical protein E3J72_16795 [Planctomycetota bacterium]
MSNRKITLLAIVMIFSLVLFVDGCGGGSKSNRSSSSGGGGGTGGGGTGTGGGGTGGGNGGGGSPTLPFGESSNGTGGSSGSTLTTPSGVTCNLIVPSSYNEGTPNEFLIVYSGTEGAGQMTSNIRNYMTVISGLNKFIAAVLDGVTYRGNGQAGADVIDEVRAKYNIDNDRMCLLGESAGTSAALELGFAIRQEYFAAYWANDVNASATPQKTAAEIGFEPWGNAGPGGQHTAAKIIVDGMRDAGYRLPADAPYSGPGANSHGDQTQFRASLTFFPGKSRQ